MFVLPPAVDEFSMTGRPMGAVPCVFIEHGSRPLDPVPTQVVALRVNCPDRSEQLWAAQTRNLTECWAKVEAERTAFCS